MNKIIPIAVGVGIVLGGGAWLATSGSNSAATTTSLSPVTAAVAQDADIELAPAFTLGQEDAPVEIIEYASFTCPHCADWHDRSWDNLKTEYIDTGMVKFTQREVYFDKYGLWAGLIARCGGESKYYGISDMIFEGQKDWIGDGQEATILENLKTIGKKAGMEEAQLETCLNDQAAAQSMVAAFQTYAAEDEVQGTPTFFINGERHSNMTWEDMKEIIDAELAG
ncbi:DsbA family protein [Maritimibacter sp. DP1N21-5]|uniref:DsbA family protein n=1 Tax=Maritimibacter sp. DP1N21-5 TaxID=2836867 RepID=UPI001C4605AA|nr:DsbA family protein [Maritimibacter sp. DP1N21-5]MBV7408243.1 DsbA family protein [Maritimibacter sp. DP1N21-5]